MTTLNSFPPVTEPLERLQRIDWIKLRRLCLTSWDTVVTAAIWTAAVLTVIWQLLARGWGLLSPRLAAALQWLEPRINPVTAPLYAPITPADIETMDRLELLMTLKARTHTPACEPVESVGDVLAKDLMALAKPELMKLAGVKSRGYTKEQLVARIQHGPASGGPASGGPASGAVGH